MYNRRLSERLRYSVGGTYRFNGLRQMPESMISEAHASFVSYSQVFLAFSCDGIFLMSCDVARSRIQFQRSSL